MAAPITDRDSALEFLLGRIDYERADRMPYRGRTLKLDRMRRLLALLGDPQRRVPAVHVAGSKGKGSTASMIAAGLVAAGWKTGLYTSPHLERLEERLVVDGAMCTSEELVELAEAVRPAVEALDSETGSQASGGPTYFEITTAMAFLHFARRQVDLAVLEVGLGGRLDSTNLCHPLVSVITSISYDHTRQLGNTLTEIAGEKAGILREGVPLVSGVLSPEPREVIREIAQRVGSPLWQLGEDFAAREIARVDGRQSLGPTLEYQFGDEPLRPVELGLLGNHQVNNAAVALTALRLVDRQGWSVPSAAMLRGLSEVRCPARIEVASHKPLVIVDTAHNVASVEALLAALQPLAPGGRKRLLFATSRDKDHAGMLAVLSRWFDEVVLTRYVNNPRSVDSQVLHAAMPADTAAEIEIDSDPAQGWQRLWSRTKTDDLVCITGSFFLAAEVRSLVHSSVAETLPLASQPVSPAHATAAT